LSLCSFLNARENRLGVQLVINDDSKIYFHLLHRDKEAIEHDLGLAVEWRELPERKQSDLTLVTSGFDLSKREQWPEQHAWICDMLETFHRALAHRVKTLDVGDYIPDDEVNE
jgi:hypothetical protein